MSERKRTRNRTTSRPAPNPDDPNAAAIGPRHEGGRYRSGYGGYTYRVDQLHRTMPGSPHGWLIEVTILDGPQRSQTRTHCTAWDWRHDTIIEQPPGVTG